MSPVEARPRAGGDTLVLAIGARRIHGAVLRGTHWQDGSTFEAMLGDAGPDAQRLAAALRALPTGAGIASLRVVVADSWLASASVPWSADQERPHDAVRAARARLQLAGHDIAGDATLRLDDAPFGAPRLAVAYPAFLLDALAQLARERGARLDSVLPMSVAAWRLARHPAALALQDEDLLVLARGRAGRMDDVRVRVTPAAAHVLQEAWRRECLRDARLATLERVALLDLTAQQAGAPSAPFFAVELADAELAPALRLAAAPAPRSALDAVAGAPGLTLRRKVVLAGAALLALAFGAQALQAGADLDAAEQARQAPRALAPVVRAADWDRTEIARVQAVNVAVRELNLPFEAILRALAPPPDLAVAVLGMGTTGGAQAAPGVGALRVKIVAEARSSADMARYVAFVAERRPFIGAYLIEHEIDETAPGRPYRFTLEASWND